MATTPAGSISLAQQHLATMLADSATFRTLVLATTRAQALAKIHHEGLPEPADGREHTREELEAYRPYAVVFTNEMDGLTRTRASTGDFVSSGRLKLRLYRNCPVGTSDEPSADANVAWKNIIGQIIDELCDLATAAAAGHLVFDEIALDFGPYWSRPDSVPTQGRWQGAELGIEWRG